MGLCLSNCEDINIIPLPPSGCTLSTRNKTISRLAFFLCTTDLADPMTCNALSTIVNAGAMVFTSELANIDVGTPEYEDVVISECRPALQKCVGRTFAFEDRIAIAAPDPNTSPVTTNNFYDYEYWRDKINNQFQLRCGIVTCDGDLIIPRDKAGNLLSVTITGTVNYQKPSTQGGGWVEFKQLSVRWNGDPLFFQEPIANLDTCNIVL